MSIVRHARPRSSRDNAAKRASGTTRDSIVFSSEQRPSEWATSCRSDQNALESWCTREDTTACRLMVVTAVSQQQQPCRRHRRNVLTLNSTDERLRASAPQPPRRAGGAPPQIAGTTGDGAPQLSSNCQSADTRARLMIQSAVGELRCCRCVPMLVAVAGLLDLATRVDKSLAAREVKSFDDHVKLS